MGTSFAERRRPWRGKGRHNRTLRCLALAALFVGAFNVWHLGALSSRLDRPIEGRSPNPIEKNVEAGTSDDEGKAPSRGDGKVGRGNLDLSTREVVCGGHKAPSCAECPQGNGRFWCNGECEWSSQSDTCVSRNMTNLVELTWASMKKNVEVDGSATAAQSRVRLSSGADRKKEIYQRSDAINGGTGNGTTEILAPRRPLLSVDDHIAWMHIPKTGTSFVNALYYFACERGPSEPLRAHGINYFEELTSKPEHRCRKEYSGNPKLTASHNQKNASFHQALSGPVYKHNKGKLVGMLRDPREHRISLTKHKARKFVQRNGGKEYNRRLRTVLQSTRGFMTGYLFGGYDFRWKTNEKEERDVIELAKDRLTEGFQYIGITNRWDESICLFYFKFVKPGDGESISCPQVVFEAVNTASDHVPAFTFTNEDWKDFENFDDDVDREVYNHALLLFETDLRRYGVTRDACTARGCWPQNE